MEKFLIQGGEPLQGRVRVSGAKNSVLPILAAGLLGDTPLCVQNVPRLVDVVTMFKLLDRLGAKVRVGVENSQNECQFDDACDPLRFEESLEKLIQLVCAQQESAPLCLSIDATKLHEREEALEAPYDLVKTMRASILVLGPLLGRFGEARVSLPGGCAIGSRPVDLHIKALRQMGAHIEIVDGFIDAKAPEGLKGAKICFDQVTVTGTENIVMAAVLAQGETIIENAAREPEIIDLVECLQAMGAEIEGAGTAVLRIQGQKRLSGARHRVIADRIEAGTFLCAAAATRGSVTVTDVDPNSLDVVLLKLEEAGAQITTADREISLTMNGARPKAVDIYTAPHPGFPTDMQAQFMAMNAVAIGSSTIVERIFENRFMHATELSRLGASIKITGSTAIVQGVETLKGAPIMATDLRASASLVIGALAAKGTTEIHRIYHMDRGYEHIESKVRLLGGRIERVKV